ncbi:MAG: hypothetical protein VYB66_03995, partial [Verrucomicrobiota bacterium]|nr:hypothetical protein [Verrucomicrobiota bacterium]
EKNYSIQLNMKHGHIFDFPEFFLFADQYIRGGKPMPVVAMPVINGGSISTTVQSDTKLIEAKLHYTTASHEQNRERAWETVDLKVDGLLVRGSAPPKEATVWYVAIRDERKAIVSSALVVP